MEDLILSKDNIFECEFKLALVQSGYDNLDTDIIDHYNHIVTSDLYKYDNRIDKLKKEFEKTLIIWGYKTGEYNGEYNREFKENIYEFKEEIKDLYKLISFYKKNKNLLQENPLIHIKLIQRCIFIKKVFDKFNYMDTFIHTHNYIKYNKYYNRIIKWANL